MKASCASWPSFMAPRSSTSAGACRYGGSRRRRRQVATRRLRASGGERLEGVTIGGEGASGVHRIEDRAPLRGPALREHVFHVGPASAGGAHVGPPLELAPQAVEPIFHHVDPRERLAVE